MLFFLFITLENNLKDTSDFIIIKQVETRKESIYLSYESLLKNTLNDCVSDPLVVKEKVIIESVKYGVKNDFFIRNNILKTENKVSLLLFPEIIKVIIYKPNKYITIKEVHITKGALYQDNLGFTVKTRKYKSTFLFPDNYVIRKVMFC